MKTLWSSGASASRIDVGRARERLDRPALVRVRHLLRADDGDGLVHARVDRHAGEMQRRRTARARVLDVHRRDAAVARVAQGDLPAHALLAGQQPRERVGEEDRLDAAGVRAARRRAPPSSASIASPATVASGKRPQRVAAEPMM